VKKNSREDRINNAYCFLNSMHSDFRTGLYYKEDLENLEHILSDYKRVLKENEELKVELERQKDINTIINQKGIDKNYEKALEKSMLKFLKTNMAKDFVSVQKVKDKIEELKQKKKKYGNCLIKMYEDELVNRDIKILQELLEGRK